MRGLLLPAYFVVDFITFVFITFFDGYEYTMWNWLFVLPINLFLSTIWPVYWALRLLFGLQ